MNKVVLEENHKQAIIWFENKIVALKKENAGLSQQPGESHCDPLMNARRNDKEEMAIDDDSDDDVAVDNNNNNSSSRLETNKWHINQMTVCVQCSFSFLCSHTQYR